TAPARHTLSTHSLHDALPIWEWTTFTGNDLGVLLGDFVLSSGRIDRPITVSSIVSSPMMAALAEARGARHVSTLTGFKWIVNARSEEHTSELQSRDNLECRLL